MNTVTPGFEGKTVAERHPGAARVGIGGPVGSGKTRLLEQLIPRFISRGTNIAVITNRSHCMTPKPRLRGISSPPATSITKIQ